MNEQLAIYLWSIVENIQIVMFTCFIGGLLLGAFFLTVGFCVEEKLNKILGCCLLVISVIGGILFPLIPSKQDLALILLYPKVKQGVETTLTSPTAKKMADVVNLCLDKQIKELKK